MKFASLTIFVSLFLSALPLLAQQNDDFQNLLKYYESYTQLQREIVFVHTNKTTYIKGEHLGFSAYIMDKGVKKLSLETTNLYVTISDINDTIVKQKLFRVINGKAFGDFIIDSLFTSGQYKIKAYTNWMRNFKEKNSFVQAIEVLDPDVEKKVSQQKLSKLDIDAQFLPEGGKLLAGIENSVGVVVKDTLGFGVPLLQGELLDSKNMVVSTFTTNQFGLGKFAFTPKNNSDYTVKIKYNDQEFSFSLGLVNDIGLAMHIENTDTAVQLALLTNIASLPKVKNTFFSLLIHNGNEAKTISLPKFKEATILKRIPRDLLFPGINIFTVFDAKNTPILERLCFNYQGLSIDHTTTKSIIKEGDSLAIKLQYKKLDSLDRISVSVLPAATRAYQPHNSILSYTLLQPYIKGAIENGSYYFQKINDKTKNDLDLLLLTQGWSSYDWNTIINDPPDYDFDFEYGIGLKAIRKDKKEKHFVLFPFKGVYLTSFSLLLNETTFEKNELFPYGEQQVRISEITKKGEFGKTNLKLTFKPDKIPPLETSHAFLGSKKNIPEVFENLKLENLISKDVQVLDEVIVTGTIKDAELEKLQAFSLGTGEKITDAMRRKTPNVLDYIRQKGFKVIKRGPGDLAILNSRPPFYAPTIFLDGLALNPPAISANDARSSSTNTRLQPANYARSSSTNTRLQPANDTGSSSTNTRLQLLMNLFLSQIDYIEFNKSGIGEGHRGAGGSIRIYTRSGSSSKKSKFKEPAYSAYEVPLTFSESRKFYVPKYSSYSTDFYEHYGVMGWFPNITADEKKIIDLKVLNPNLHNIRLFVEGVTKNGDFISERIIIPVK